MLYKPKFLSPAMTNETKVLEYNKKDEYVFSCVCEGNEKILSGNILIEQDLSQNVNNINDYIWKNAKEDDTENLAFYVNVSKPNNNNDKGKYIQRIDDIAIEDNVGFPIDLVIDKDKLNNNSNPSVLLSDTNGNIVKQRYKGTLKNCSNYIDVFYSKTINYKDKEYYIKLIAPTSLGINHVERTERIKLFASWRDFHFERFQIKNSKGQDDFSNDDDYTYLYRSNGSGVSIDEHDSEWYLTAYYINDGQKIYLNNYNDIKTILNNSNKFPISIKFNNITDAEQVFNEPARFEQNIDFNQYPINSNGQFNSFNFNCNLNKAGFYPGMGINWQIKFYGENNTTVVSSLEKTLLINSPKIKWKGYDYINNNTIIDLNTSKENYYLLKSSVGDFNISINNYYPIQYYYYEICDINEEKIYYTSEHFYSSEIKIKYSGFYLNNNYCVKLYIIDSMNRIIESKQYLKCYYDSSITSGNFKSKILSYEEGNYIEWSGLTPFVASYTPEEYSNGLLQTPSFIKSLTETILEDNKVYENYIAELTNEKQTIQLNDLNIKARGIFLCCRFKEIPIYSEIPKNASDFKPFISYTWGSTTYSFGIGKFKTTNKYTNHLIFYNSQNIDRPFLISNKDMSIIDDEYLNENAWYIMYFAVDAGDVYPYVKIKRIDSSISFPRVGKTILGNNIINNEKTAQIVEGVWNLPQEPEIWKTKQDSSLKWDMQLLRPLNKVCLSGTDNAVIQISYLFILNETIDSQKNMYDYYGLGLNEKGEKDPEITSVFDELNAINYQPYWQYGFINKYKYKDTEDIYYASSASSNSAFLDGNFQASLNFEPWEAIASDALDTEQYQYNIFSNETIVNQILINAETESGNKLKFKLKNDSIVITPIDKTKDFIAQNQITCAIPVNLNYGYKYNLYFHGTNLQNIKKNNDEGTLYVLLRLSDVIGENIVQLTWNFPGTAPSKIDPTKYYARSYIYNNSNLTQQTFRISIRKGTIIPKEGISIKPVLTYVKNLQMSGIEKNVLTAGDPSYQSNFSTIDIKRQTVEENSLKTIATFNYNDKNSKFALIDYSIKNNKEYKYYLFPNAIIPIVLNDGTKYSYQKTLNYLSSNNKSFKQNFDKWILYIASENPNNKNECYIEQMIMFDLNLTSGSMTNNATPTTVKNFTKYPRIQQSPHSYWSGTLKGLLGVITPDNNTFIQTPEQLNEFKSLTLDGRRKFLKDRDGNLFEVEISGALTIENKDNLIIDLKTKSLPWIEIGDADNVSLIIKDQNQIDWILTENGYPNYLTNYQWSDTDIWLDDKVWTEKKEE